MTGDPADAASRALAAVVRQDWGRLVALLLARYRRLDLVEDALGDAVEAAARTWAGAVPDRPAAWLLTAARRAVVDRLRREATAQRVEPLLVIDAATRRPGGVMVDDGSHVEDDLLRLVLMCTHPAVPTQTAAALALRLVLGVPTGEIARLFLVSEPTMAARLTRGKKRIVQAGVPFAVPAAADLPERLDVVADVAYLAFTAGYAPGTGPDLLRADLAAEAIRLVRVVLSQVGEDPGLQALLALMLVQHSRRDARVDAAGALVLLPDQDRRRWHREEIEEAVRLLGGVGPAQSARAESFRLQALVALEHALAPRADQTRWDRIVTFYDALVVLTGSPAVALARAVAVAEDQGPQAGLDALAALVPTSVPGHRLPAVRGELLARAGRHAEAARSIAQAIECCGNDVERAHLAARLAEMPGRHEPPRASR